MYVVDKLASAKRHERERGRVGLLDVVPFAGSLSGFHDETPEEQDYYVFARAKRNPAAWVRPAHDFESLLLEPQSLALEQGLAASVRSVTYELGEEWNLPEDALHVMPAHERPWVLALPGRILEGSRAWMHVQATSAMGVRAEVEPEPSPQPLDWDRAVRQIRAERDAYERHKQEILSRYEGRYVAVVNGNVIDSDGDYGRLAERVFARLGRRVVLLIRATRESDRAVVRSGLVRATPR